MRKLILLASLLLALPLVALAQDQPKVEIFGGYSWFNPEGDDNDLHGWNASVTGNLNKWFGIKSDFSGYYDRATLPSGVRISANTHFFMVGGQFAYRKSDRVQPFAHLMVGTSRAHLTVTRTCAPTVAGCVARVSGTDVGFAFMAGGGVDVKLIKSLAARVIQADYVLVRDEGENFHGLRLSTGLVLRLGDH
jgi:opacity protein-like surface antigen